MTEATDSRRGPSVEMPGKLSFLVRGLSGGGAQRDAIMLANGIASRGVACAVVTLDAEGPLADLIAPSVDLIDLGRGRKLRMAAAIPALRRFYAGERPDVFVASEASGNTLAVIAMLMTPPSQRPMIVLREVASPLQARNNDPYVQNRIAYRMAPWIYPRADLVVTLTEAVRRDLMAHFRVPADRVVCLGTNAVMARDDFARLETMPKRPEPGLIAAVGRLSPEKDFATLIEAVDIVRNARPVRLEIAGEGTGRAALESMIRARGLSDHVTLLGYQHDPAALLSRAALFVSSSRHEGFGNAIVEAMAAGVPVVSTDAPYGPREILAGGRWGALVPVGNVGELARAIVNALESPPDTAGARLRANDFTAESAAAAFIANIEKRGGRPV
ncbi:MAG: glycosyltransferase [Rhodobiaceae bacterium]|nr:glycosyltransferase [Rhodobiaceae bacterium]MCC0055239.1 glycosyltransferase [Rhodobiaceae bacterium]